MNKDIIFTLLTAGVIAGSVMPLSSLAETGDSSGQSGTQSTTSQADPYAPTDPNVYTLTFLAPDGTVLSSYQAEEGSTIDYSAVDTSSLSKHIDIYTEQEFCGWDQTPETVTGDTTFHALMQTAVISMDSLPSRTRYASTNGTVDLSGLKVTITLTKETPQKDSSGKYITETSNVDISSTCAAKPSSLSEAFAGGDTATIAIYPIGQDKSIVSFDISTAGNIGDVDGSGSVDGSDATLILKCYAERPSNPDYVLTDLMSRHGDINFDNSIDGSDATLVLKYYASKGGDPNLTIESFLDEAGITY